MDANDTSYMDFLRVNFKGTADTIDALKATAPKGNTPEELKKNAAEIEEKIKAVVNKEECVRDYQAFQKLPDGIKARFNGTKVPEDIMEAARRDEILTLIEMDTHPEIKRAEDARAAVREKYGLPGSTDFPTDIHSEAALAVFAVAMVAGYSEYSGQRLAQQRQHREGFLEEIAAILTDPKLSEADKKAKLKDWLENKWLKSREDTINTIKDDWRGNPAKHRKAQQPEKYLVHLLAKLDHGKISDTQRKDLMQQIADYAQMIETDGRQDKLLEYLKKRNIQTKIGHFSNETRDVLANLVLHNVPESEKERYLARDWRKEHGLKETMSADHKAQAAAQATTITKLNALPQSKTLKTEESQINKPTRLRLGHENERQA